MLHGCAEQKDVYRLLYGRDVMCAIQNGCTLQKDVYLMLCECAEQRDVYRLL